jgi:hypothetical protein
MRVNPEYGDKFSGNPKIGEFRAAGGIQSGQIRS